MHTYNLKKNKTNYREYNRKKNRLTDIESKLVVTYGKTEEGRVNIGAQH